MEQEFSHEKPCPVETGRGFSVFYKGRYLYSKYDPKKTVLSLVDSLQIIPGTLLVCNSPLLFYGTKELFEKLPENCFLLFLETDESLYNFSLHYYEELNFSNTFYLPACENRNLAEFINGQKSINEFNFPKLYNFKRAFSLEMSGGASLNAQTYKNLFSIIQASIGSFWKNRLTLVKFGRMYSRNLFHNMCLLPESIDIKNFFRKINRPIFVFGAGESTEKTISSIPADILKKCFILAVDAALPILKRASIIPDGIVAVEGQLAIEKNYIGNCNEKSIIFADMASRSQVSKHTTIGASYFSSEYCEADFLNRIRQAGFFPPSIPPLGSVGLTAVYLALRFRSSNDIPVFFTGFDFSYSKGFTHARGAFHHEQRLIDSTRLRPVANYDAAFKQGAASAVGKDGHQIVTDITLSGYAENFATCFSKQENLFDAGESGLYLNIPLLSSEQISNFLSKHDFRIEKNISKKYVSISKTEKKAILDFFKKEEKALNRIKELLVLGKDVESCSIPLEKELENLISQREYLFLHFPDGFKYKRGDLSFIKRIRSELDFFIKDMKAGIRKLTSDDKQP